MAAKVSGEVIASSPGSKSGGKSGAMQRCGPAAETHGIARANPRRERFFKLTHLGPGGQPVGAQRFDHGLNIFFINRLPSIRKQRWSAPAFRRECARASFVGAVGVIRLLGAAPEPEFLPCTRATGGALPSTNL